MHNTIFKFHSFVGQEDSEFTWNWEYFLPQGFNQTIPPKPNLPTPTNPVRYTIKGEEQSEEGKAHRIEFWTRIFSFARFLQFRSSLRVDWRLFADKASHESHIRDNMLGILLFIAACSSSVILSWLNLSFHNIFIHVLLDLLNWRIWPDKVNSCGL